MIKVSKEFILNLYKPIVSNTHKGLQGHALLIGGSYGKMGSVCLSSKAPQQSFKFMYTLFARCMLC
jgi:NAD(P)H-hydrate repair Nnr-like enzyme with NAD(P)H-hydrate dehydratase domain